MKRRWLTFLLSCVLALFCLVSPVWAMAARTPTYSPDQVEKIQQYLPRVTQMRDRLAELSPLVQSQNWLEIRSRIHGPLGELRMRVNRLIALLLPADQVVAKASAESLYDHLNVLDAQAESAAAPRVAREYKAALADLDAILKLVPGM